MVVGGTVVGASEIKIHEDLYKYEGPQILSSFKASALLAFHDPQCVGYLLIIKKPFYVHSTAVRPTVCLLYFLDPQIHLSWQDVSDELVPVWDFGDDAILICLYDDVVAPERSTIPSPADVAQAVVLHWIMTRQNHCAALRHQKRWHGGPMSCMGKFEQHFRGSFGHEYGYIVLVHVMNNNKQIAGGWIQVN